MPKPDLVFTHTEKPKPHQNDAAWKEEAVRNAKHKANVFIELGDAKRTAESFSQIPPLEAMSHLHRLADKYRHESQFKRADVVLMAAELIRPKETEKHVPGKEHWHQFRNHIPKMKRRRPVEVLTDDSET